MHACCFLQEEVHQRLQAAFPLIHFDEQDAAILRQRRCTACVGVTAFMAATPKLNNSVKAKIMKLPAEDGSGVCVCRNVIHEGNCPTQSETQPLT